MSGASDDHLWKIERKRAARGRLDRKKEARGEAFRGIRFIQVEKVDKKKP
jgi:hypothetical protein